MFHNLYLEFGIAFRYFTSSKRFSFVSFPVIMAIMSVATVVMVLTVVTSVMSGFEKELLNSGKGLLGDLTIEAPVDFDEKSAEIATVIHQSQIKAAAPYFMTQAYFSRAPFFQVVTIQGIDPIKESQISSISTYIVSGNMQLSAQDILVGKVFATKYTLIVGDRIQVTFPITMKTATFVIRGIFSSGIYMYDSALLVSDLNSARQLAAAPGKISGYKLRLRQPEELHAYKVRIEKEMPRFWSINTWIESNSSLYQTIVLQKKIAFIVLSMVFLLAGFCIAASLMISVLQKRREILVLKTLGFTNGSFLRIFLIYGCIITGVGYIVGVLLGVGIVWNINEILKVLSSLFDLSFLSKELVAEKCIPTSMNMNTFGLLFGVCMVIALLSSLLPAVAAYRIDPASELK